MTMFSTFKSDNPPFAASHFRVSVRLNGLASDNPHLRPNPIQGPKNIFLQNFYKGEIVGNRDQYKHTLLQHREQKD